MNAKAILICAVRTISLLLGVAGFVHALEPLSLQERSMVRGEVYALMRRAERRAAAEDFAAAADLLTAASALDPSYPALLLRRGQMRLALFQWDAALSDFTAALAINPAYAEAYFQRGLLYASVLQSGAAFYDEALSDFRVYLKLAPDGPRAERARAAVAMLEAYFTGQGGAGFQGRSRFARDGTIITSSAQRQEVGWFRRCTFEARVYGTMMTRMG